jgi:hypothetical protein
MGSQLSTIFDVVENGVAFVVAVRGLYKLYRRNFPIVIVDEVIREGELVDIEMGIVERGVN